MKTFGILSLLLLGTLPSVADPVREAIDLAVTAYEAGRFGEAAGQLDYAAQLVREKKASGIGDALPEPPEGWTADEVKVEAVGGGFIGNMIRAERTYRKDDASVTIEVVSDSPMLAQISMFLSNPAMIRQSGAELVRIDGKPAMLKDENGRIEVTGALGGTVLLTVKGKGASRDDVLAFCGLVDSAKVTSQ